MERRSRGSTMELAEQALSFVHTSEAGAQRNNGAAMVRQALSTAGLISRVGLRWHVGVSQPPATGQSDGAGLRDRASERRSRGTAILQSGLHSLRINQEDSPMSM